MFSDKTCYVLKIKCAHEAFNWIKFKPELFLVERKILTKLMCQIVDRVSTYIFLLYFDSVSSKRK